MNGSTQPGSVGRFAHAGIQTKEIPRKFNDGLWRSRWATVGAATAITLGLGGALGIGAGSEPALLPGLTREALQPSQQHLETADTARIDYAWSGLVAFTRDQMPRAGRLDGAYYAGGYCGHGVAMATHLGEQIARRMAGESIEHPLFDDRFAAIPLYRGTPWFLPLVGAYYQVKDWLQ